MAGECAFCGRSSSGHAARALCDDCGTEHEICATCAAELAKDAELEGVRLIAA
jgi:hypothetical protein